MNPKGLSPKPFLHRLLYARLDVGTLKPKLVNPKPRKPRTPQTNPERQAPGRGPEMLSTGSLLDVGFRVWD